MTSTGTTDRSAAAGTHPLPGVVEAALVGPIIAAAGLFASYALLPDSDVEIRFGLDVAPFILAPFLTVFILLATVCISRKSVNNDFNATDSWLRRLICLVHIPFNIVILLNAVIMTRHTPSMLAAGTTFAVSLLAAFGLWFRTGAWRTATCSPETGGSQWPN